jgi:hypothetical protein
MLVHREEDLLPSLDQGTTHQSLLHNAIQTGKGKEGLTSGVPQEISLRKLPLSPNCHLFANPKSTKVGTSL